MTNRSCPRYAALAILIGALSLPSGLLAMAPATPVERPNIVIIFCDDLGYGDVGVFGARGYRTPNIDRLASEGIRLTRFYTAQAVCSASRAALLTGCYPNRIGIKGALGPRSKVGIHDDEVTLGELLAMGRTRSPAQATEYAEIIQRESQRLSRLIDSVLDFSKIERGVGVYEFSDDQDVAEVVRRALDISRHRLEQAHMELHVDIDDVPPARIDTNAIMVGHGTGGPTSNLTVMNNIVDGTTLVNLGDSAPGLKMDFNLYAPKAFRADEAPVDFTSWQTRGLDAASVFADPAFTALDTLLPGAIAVDKGSNVGLPFCGGAPDLGAVETGC